MTDRSRSPSSPGISGSIGPETSEGDLLEMCLDLLEDLVYEAVGVEECFNPAEYEIPAEIVLRANQILELEEWIDRDFPD